MELQCQNEEQKINYEVPLLTPAIQTLNPTLSGPEWPEWVTRS